MRPKPGEVCLQGVSRFGWFSIFETCASGGLGVHDDAWRAFDDVGPAGGVGDLLDFALGWWFLAASHGVWASFISTGIFQGDGFEAFR